MSRNGRHYEKVEADKSRRNEHENTECVYSTTDATVFMGSVGIILVATILSCGLIGKKQGLLIGMCASTTIHGLYAIISNKNGKHVKHLMNMAHKLLIIYIVAHAMYEGNIGSLMNAT